MPPFETVETDAMVTACNGDGGPLGHPRVFLNLAPSGRAECPYCSRVFINPAAAHPGAHGASAASDKEPPPRQP